MRAIELGLVSDRFSLEDVLWARCCHDFRRFRVPVVASLLILCLHPLVKAAHLPKGLRGAVYWVLLQSVIERELFDLVVRAPYDRSSRS